MIFHELLILKPQLRYASLQTELYVTIKKPPVLWSRTLVDTGRAWDGEQGMLEMLDKGDVG